MNKVRVTVLMTAYNGEKYVEKQIDTILSSLGENDELLISDDGSKDSTRIIIENIVSKDSRVKLLDGPRKGLNQNINYLLDNANGEYIFIADQDDMWYENKVEVILDYFNKNPNIDVIHHDSNLIDSNDKVIGKTVYNSISFSKKLVKFIIKSHIFGSMIAMRKRFLKYDFVPKKTCYDGGIACYAMRTNKLMFINDVLMGYRRHENNMSTFKRRKFYIIFVERMRLIWFILTRVMWLKKNKRRSNDEK